MTTLIIGGTGRVGGPTAQALAAQGKDVRVLTRSAEKADALSDGITGVVGDLDTANSLAAAFDGVDQLLLITANGETEQQRGTNAVQAAVDAGVKKIVFLSVKLSDEAMKVPHYASKVAIEDAIRASGIISVILRPDFFFQNDLLLGRAIAGAGVYTMPIGNKGQNRIDTRDIADAAARALTTKELDNHDIALYGPKTWTADEIATLYGEHLGREVRYAGDDLDAWEESSKAFMPPWLLGALKAGFAKMQKMGSVASNNEIAKSEHAVGHPLRRFEDFVAEVTPAWKN
ncbi:MAG: NmrA family NAD(P)-binding protein [Rhodospirillaceae bacterium]